MRTILLLLFGLVLFAMLGCGQKGEERVERRPATGQTATGVA